MFFKNGGFGRRFVFRSARNSIFLVEAIEADKYPLSARVELLRRILAKFGEVGGLPP